MPYSILLNDTLTCMLTFCCLQVRILQCRYLMVLTYHSNDERRHTNLTVRNWLWQTRPRSQPVYKKKFWCIDSLIGTVIPTYPRWQIPQNHALSEPNQQTHRASLLSIFQLPSNVQLWAERRIRHETFGLIVMVVVWEIEPVEFTNENKPRHRKHITDCSAVSASRSRISS